MDILRHELYKIYARKSLYLAALFFLLIVAFTVYGSSREASIHRQLANYLGAAQGPVTEQKVKLAEQGQIEMNNHFEATPEGAAKSFFYSAIVSMNNQIKNRSAQLEELRNVINNLEKTNSVNTFDYSANVMQYKMLKNTNIEVVGYSEGWAMVINFIPTLGFGIMGAMILLGLSPVFSEEYSTNMASIILSSKQGKGKVITAKILAACIYITSLVLLFSIIYVSAYFYVLGTTGGEYALQNIHWEIFSRSPYALTISHYFMYEMSIHLAGSLAFGLLVLLLSSLNRSALIPLFAGGLVFATPLTLLNLGVHIAWINPLIELSYIEVMRVEDIFKDFKVYNFFGYPIAYLEVSLLVMAVLSMVSVWLTYYTFKHHQVS
jgi:hypothetical protein